MVRGGVLADHELGADLAVRAAARDESRISTSRAERPSGSTAPPPGRGVERSIRAEERGQPDARAARPSPLAAAAGRADRVRAAAGEQHPGVLVGGVGDPRRGAHAAVERHRLGEVCVRRARIAERGGEPTEVAVGGAVRGHADRRSSRSCPARAELAVDESPPCPRHRRPPRRPPGRSARRATARRPQRVQPARRGPRELGRAPRRSMPSSANSAARAGSHAALAPAAGEQELDDGRELGQAPLLAAHAEHLDAVAARRRRVPSGGGSSRRSAGRRLGLGQPAVGQRDRRGVELRDVQDERLPGPPGPVPARRPARAGRRPASPIADQRGDPPLAGLGLDLEVADLARRCRGPRTASRRRPRGSVGAAAPVRSRQHGGQPVAVAEPAGHGHRRGAEVAALARCAPGSRARARARRAGARGASSRRAAARPTPPRAARGRRRRRRPAASRRSRSRSRPRPSRTPSPSRRARSRRPSGTSRWRVRAPPRYSAVPRSSSVANRRRSSAIPTSSAVRSGPRPRRRPAPPRGDGRRAQVVVDGAGRVAERRRARVVVGQVGQHAVGRMRLATASRASPIAQVQLGPAQPGQAGDDGAADELVGEAVREPPAPGTSSIIPLRSASSSAGGGRRGSSAEARGDDVEVELGAGHGGELERVAGRRARAGTGAGPRPRARSRAWPARRAGAGRRTRPSSTATAPVSTSIRQSSQSRNALPPVSSPMACGQRRRRGAGGAGHEGRDLLLAEADEPQPHDVLGAPQVGQRVGELGRDVGVGVPERGHHQHARRRPRSGPGGAAGAASARRPSDSPRAAGASGRRRPTAASSSVTAVCSRWRSVSGSASTAGPGPSIRSGRSGSSRASSLPALPRSARRVSGSLVRTSQSSASTNGRYGVWTAASQAPYSTSDALGGRLAGELADQAALARPGLAADQRGTAAVAVEPRQQRAQRRELPRPADEREGRREPQRSWKWELVGSSTRQILSIRRRVNTCRGCGATIVRSGHRRRRPRRSSSVGGRWRRATAPTRSHREHHLDRGRGSPGARSVVLRRPDRPAGRRRTTPPAPCSTP